MNSKRYFIHFSFDGTAYHGWQRQENALTVQEVLEQSLSLVCREEIELTGCGRTDAGVHAAHFYAHFDLEVNWSPTVLQRLPRKLNSILPKDIAVKEIYPVANEMHARFSPLSRTYQYRISRTKDPFLEAFSYYYPLELDVVKMNEGARVLFEYEDFSCFSRSHTQVKTNLCKIYGAQWESRDDLLIFTITADRFLRNMVRAICGTLIDLGRGRIDLQDLRSIIESKKRSNAGKSMPAKGLFLTAVEYPG